MLQVLDSMGAFTLAVDYYLQGSPFGLKLGAMARMRTAVQQRLLLLPTAEELGIPSPLSEPKPNIYECCRLTALIYGVAVVLPVPHSHSMLQELVRRLMIVIRGLDNRTFGVELGGVLLWMLVLGGIAALDTPERNWFASQLAWIVRRLDIGDWGGVEDILGSFLWLDSVCGQGGRLLWSEAMAAS
jgi:Fungal specific transcription factor domain